MFEFQATVEVICFACAGKTLAPSAPCSIIGLFEFAGESGEQLHTDSTSRPGRLGEQLADLSVKRFDSLRYRFWKRPVVRSADSHSCSKRFSKCRPFSLFRWQAIRILSECEDIVQYESSGASSGQAGLAGVSCPHPLPRASLGVWDVVSLNIGIVVGVSIFRVPGDVFKLAGSPALGLGLWVLGAVLALTGALCYAELAATYPRFGAEYDYLGRAYGAPIGFLFGWMQTFVILPASVGAMAFVFATYAAEIWPALQPHSGLCAAAAIGTLTLLQLIGFQTGRMAQNVLTLVKVVSLIGVLICGLWLAPRVPLHPVKNAMTTSTTWSELGLALVFVFYSYGGWSDVARVTPEVRNCRQNMPRALMIGLMLIATLYLLLNLSFLKGLGEHDLRGIQAPAAEVVRRALGSRFSNVMSLIIMASALGAIHGMLFSGCRLLAAIGQDYRWFERWNQWNKRQVPVWALLTLSAISLVTTAAVGTARGRHLIDTLLSALFLTPPDWEQFSGGFDVLVIASSPIFWGFFLLAGLALIVLRIRDADRPRPFRVPLYPLTPLVFAGMSAYMLWSGYHFAGKLTLLMLPILGLGVLLAIVQPSPRPPDVEFSQ